VLKVIRALGLELHGLRRTDGRPRYALGAGRRTSRLLDDLAQGRADGTHFHLLLLTLAPQPYHGRSPRVGCAISASLARLPAPWRSPEALRA
jgi:hypothetical protein